MRRATRVVVFVLLAVSTACGGGGASKDAGQRRFLLVVHSPLAGSIASKPDAELITLGQQVCAKLDAHVSSDDIVTSMSGDALPGSAAYNAYSYLVVSAGSDLCPNNAAQFNGTIPTGD